MIVRRRMSPFTRRRRAYSQHRIVQGGKRQNMSRGANVSKLRRRVSGRPLGR